MSGLSTPIESIPPMDVLVALGRGEDDYERVGLVLDIAESVAADPSRERIAEFLGPRVVLCGNKPWHGPPGSHANGGRAEATSSLRYAHMLINQNSTDYEHLDEDQFTTVGGDSTVASMVEIAKSPELIAHPEWSITFFTDKLHNRYGRVGRLALAAFGDERSLNVVTFSQPRGVKEEVMESGMSLMTYWDFRNVGPGAVDQAVAAQLKVEKHIRAIPLVGAIGMK